MSSRALRAQLPPGPLLPSAVQTALWFRRPLDVLERCRARYGDTFTLRIAYEGDWVVVSHPDAVRQVFTTDPAVAHAGEGNIVLSPILGRHSVLLLDEAEHLEQRRLLLPPFHGRRMEGYGELMSSIAAAEIERWPLERPFALRAGMQAITLEIILRAVIGVSDGDRLARLREELRRLLDMLTNPRYAWVLIALGPERLARFPPFERALRPVDRMLYEEIADRRRARDLEGRVDVLSLLLQAQHEDGSPMADRELRDELMTLLVAGHETTATALGWAIERLARDPAKLERLTSEADAGGSEYAEATVKETLRLRPVISVVVRKLTEPLEVGGWSIPPGVSVVPCIDLVHRRPEEYPEPQRFSPERFLERTPGTYTWIPFGGGVRRCLGASFAEFEMRTVLAELVTRRSIRPVRAASERRTRRAITNVPGRGTEVILSDRPRRAGY